MAYLEKIFQFHQSLHRSCQPFNCFNLFIAVVNHSIASISSSQLSTINIFGFRDAFHFLSTWRASLIASVLSSCMAKSQLLGNPHLFLVLQRRVEESILLSCKLRLRDIYYFRIYLINVAVTLSDKQTAVSALYVGWWSKLGTTKWAFFLEVGWSKNPTMVKDTFIKIYQNIFLYSSHSHEKNIRRERTILPLQLMSFCLTIWVPSIKFAILTKTW